uniref:Uncharacterized protein n=1 Tax=Arundo donax TaxID=35708 RepID=A0A0A8Z5D7_ARUDO
MMEQFMQRACLCLGRSTDGLVWIIRFTRLSMNAVSVRSSSTSTLTKISRDRNGAIREG